MRLGLGLVASVMVLMLGFGNVVANSDTPNSVVQLDLNNTVTFRSEVSSESVNKAILELQVLVEKRGNKDYPIYLVIDSPGGDIYAGLSFIEFTKNIKNLKTISLFAASMASAFVEHLPGERLVLENSVLMFHRAAGRFQGQFNNGEVESQLALWKSIVQDMEEKNAKRMGMPIEDYKNKVKDELWIYGKNNVSTGAADKVVNVQCSAKLIAETETIREVTLFFSINYVYSKCPLIQAPITIEELGE